MSEREGNEDCDDCATSFVQVFDRQPWAFLWWVDHHLHQLHKSHYLHRRLCDFIDRRLWMLPSQEN